MTAFTEGWAMSNDQVGNPAEVLVLLGVARTVGTDNFMAEVRLDELMGLSRLDELGVRSTLNELVKKGLVRNVRPKEGEQEDDPRVFDCEVNTPQDWHWDF